MTSNQEERHQALERLFKNDYEKKYKTKWLIGYFLRGLLIG